MKILIISNFYPPYTLGGQERSCQQVVDGLKRKGHQVVVLTSMFGINQPVEDPGDVKRILYLETDMVPWRESFRFFRESKKREIHNLTWMQRYLDDFSPDIVFVWGMWNMSLNIPALAEATFPDRVVYRFADYWPTLPNQKELYWRTPARVWFYRIPKRLIAVIALALLRKAPVPPSLNFKRAICVSTATHDKLLESGIKLKDTRVIHTGIDASLYLNNPEKQSIRSDQKFFKLLYAGRLAPEKGIETLIHAMDNLVKRGGYDCIRLNLAGPGIADHEKYLRDLVCKNDLNEFVTFLGVIPNEKMPLVMAEHDVLLLPSRWAEPFPRIILEGMLSGLVVLATPNGGIREIIKNGENGLFFSPGDHLDLSKKIILLMTNSNLRQVLSQEGQKVVLKCFTYTKMIDEIEAYLEEIRSSRKQVDEITKLDLISEKHSRIPVESSA
jgi:glycosyltransferase involved in cell wall biosynthesis